MCLNDSLKISVFKNFVDGDGMVICLHLHCHNQEMLDWCLLRHASSAILFTMWFDLFIKKFLRKLINCVSTCFLGYFLVLIYGFE